MEKNADGLEPRPHVGIGIMIKDAEDKVLLGQRMSSHGAGQWAFPGGNLEFGETIFETARREVKEETDLDIDTFDLISICDEMQYIETDNKHYVDISLLAHYQGGVPRNVEPHKCQGWQWFPLDALPENLFESTAITLQNYKDKVTYRSVR